MDIGDRIVLTNHRSTDLSIIERNPDLEFPKIGGVYTIIKNNPFSYSINFRNPTSPESYWNVDKSHVKLAPIANEVSLAIPPIF